MLLGSLTVLTSVAAVAHYVNSYMILGKGVGVVTAVSGKREMSIVHLRGWSSPRHSYYSCLHPVRKSGYTQAVDAQRGVGVRVCGATFRCQLLNQSYHSLADFFVPDVGTPPNQ